MDLLGTAVLVAVSTAAIHGLWTWWSGCVASGQAVRAGLATVAIEICGAYVIVEYVADKRLIVAACIGGFFGAYLPVHIKRRGAK